MTWTSSILSGNGTSSANLRPWSAGTQRSEWNASVENTSKCNDEVPPSQRHYFSAVDRKPSRGIAGARGRALSQQSFCGAPVAFARAPAAADPQDSGCQGYAAAAPTEPMLKEVLQHLDRLRSDVCLHCQELAGVVAAEVERHGSRSQRQQKLKAAEQASMVAETATQLAPQIERALATQEERSAQAAAREVKAAVGGVAENWSQAISKVEQNLRRQLVEIESRLERGVQKEFELSRQFAAQAMASDSESRQQDLKSALEEVLTAVQAEVERNGERVLERLRQAAEENDRRNAQERLEQMRTEMSMLLREEIERHGAAMQSGFKDLERLVQDSEKSAAAARADAVRAEREALGSIQALDAKIEASQAASSHEASQVLEAVRETKASVISAAGQLESTIGSVQQAVVDSSSKNLTAVESVETKLGSTETAVLEAFGKVEHGQAEVAKLMERTVSNNTKKLKMNFGEVMDKLSELESKVDQSDLLQAIQRMDPQDMLNALGKVGVAIEKLDAKMNNSDLLDAIQQFDPAEIVAEVKQIDTRGVVNDILTAVHGIGKELEGCSSTHQVERIQGALDSLRASMDACSSKQDVVEVRSAVDTVRAAMETCSAKQDVVEVRSAVDALRATVETCSAKQDVENVRGAVDALQGRMETRATKQDVAELRNAMDTLLAKMETCSAQREVAEVRSAVDRLAAQVDHSTIIDEIRQLDPKPLVGKFAQLEGKLDDIAGGKVDQSQVIDAIGKLDTRHLNQEFSKLDAKVDELAKLDAKSQIQVGQVLAAVEHIGTQVGNADSKKEIGDILASVRELSRLDHSSLLEEVMRAVNDMGSRASTADIQVSIQNLHEALKRLEASVSESISKFGSQQTELSDARDRELMSAISGITTHMAQRSSATATDENRLLDEIAEIRQQIAASKNVLDAVSTNMPEHFKEMAVKSDFTELQEAMRAVAKEKQDISPLLAEVGKVREYCEGIHGWLVHLRSSMEQWGMEHVHQDMIGITGWLESVHKVLKEAANSNTVTSAGRGV